MFFGCAGFSISIVWYLVEFIMLGHLNLNHVDDVMTFLISAFIAYRENCYALHS